MAGEAIQCLVRGGQYSNLYVAGTEGTTDIPETRYKIAKRRTLEYLEWETSGLSQWWASCELVATESPQSSPSKTQAPCCCRQTHEHGCRWFRNARDCCVVNSNFVDQTCPIVVSSEGPATYHQVRVIVGRSKPHGNRCCRVQDTIYKQANLVALANCEQRVRRPVIQCRTAFDDDELNAIC